MNAVRQFLQIISVMIFLGFFPCLSVAGATVDHRPWSELLAAHVRDGWVDYRGFKQDEGKLDAYLQILDRGRPGELGRSERLAYYINAYNAWTVKLILMHFRDGKPLASIKDIGGLFLSPWSLEIARLGGEVMSLDAIEHTIIRPEFMDPRIHFAISCASKSCPPLLDTAYTGEKLEQQLDERVTTFINDNRFTYLRGDTLYVSRLFSWYAKDFDDDIRGFVARYARDGLKRALQEKGNNIKVKYLDYDWSLNGNGNGE